MQFTLLLLWRGRMSKVRTYCVRLAIPRAAMPDPVKTPPVVITAAPPAPAKNPVVPVMPTVAKAAPRPAPMTGARSPAESPITSPPPVRKNSSIRHENLLEGSRMACQSLQDPSSCTACSSNSSELPRLHPFARASRHSLGSPAPQLLVVRI